MHVERKKWTNRRISIEASITTLQQRLKRLLLHIHCEQIVNDLRLQHLNVPQNKSLTSKFSRLVEL